VLGAVRLVGWIFDDDRGYGNGSDNGIFVALCSTASP